MAISKIPRELYTYEHVRTFYNFLGIQATTNDSRLADNQPSR